MFEIYCHVHSNTSMGMLSHLSSYTYRLILNDLIIHRIWKNMFKRKTVQSWTSILNKIISTQNMFKFSSYGDNFPPLISTHAARFKFCILITLHACHTNFTSILTHSSTPFLPLHLPIATILSVAITHPFKLSSLLAKAHIISCGEMMWYADPCVHFFCHWWL